MKRVLVLGGGGFIGGNIVRYLLRRGDCDVVAADLGFPRGWGDIDAKNESGGRRPEVIVGDFSSPRAFEGLRGLFDEVYMMAAVVGVNRTLEEPQEVIRVNTQLTMNTLEWIRANPVKRLLFASSSENYAGTFDSFGAAVPTPETVPLCISDIRHPRFTYAVTKIHGEAAFLHSSKALGFECVIVRYQNIIGPDMGFRHAIPHIVQRFWGAQESPFKVYGSDQTRAFCYIDDAVAGTVAAMESDRASGEIYHIGNDVEITMDRLTREIGRLMGYQGEYIPAMTYPGSVGRRCPEIQKSRDHLGYRPQVSWESAVERTVGWYRNYFANGGRPVTGGFAPPEKFFVR